MALLQISEPGMSTAPHQHRLAVGIDLGTTNSLVATVRNSIPEVLNDEEGHSLLPSVVRYLPNGHANIGYKALAAQTTDPKNTIVSVKRFMGRGLADIAYAENLPYDFQDTPGMVQLKTVAGVKSPVEVSAQILATLRQRAEDSLGDDLVGAVITVPAYFDDAQRQATKDAAQLAGINVLRLLSEPTAAAIAYGLDNASEGVYAVYDLGGGTFDISILKLSKGVFEVLSTGGDSALGGDDFDRRLFCWISEQAKLAPLSDEDTAILLVMNDTRVLKARFFGVKESGGKVGRRDAQVDFLARVQLGVLADPAEQAAVEIVAAQSRVAARGQHFEDALAQFQDRDVEGAAAQVVHGVHAFGRVIEAVGDGGGRRLAQQTQDIDAGQLGRIFRRLALGIVEIRWYSNHGAHQVVAERVFRALAQGGEDLRRHFDGAFHAGHGFQLHHAGRVLEIVGQVFRVGDVGQAAAHEALDGNDGVLRVGRLRGQGLVADVGMAVRQVAHDGRQQGAPVFVVEHFGNAVADGRDQGIGGAKIDADGQAVLVRRGRHAWFGDLQKCHCIRASINLLRDAADAWCAL